MIVITGYEVALVGMKWLKTGSRSAATQSLSVFQLSEWGKVGNYMLSVCGNMKNGD